MPLTVPLSPEQEQQLQERARQRGQDVTTYVQGLIDRELKAPQARENGIAPTSAPTQQSTSRNDMPRCSDDELPLGLRPVLPGIQRSLDAFHRDLPELMKTHYGQWVAYHGDKRIGFGRTQTALYQECVRRGLKKGEFIVEGVMHQIDYDDM